VYGIIDNVVASPQQALAATNGHSGA